jgi:methionyl-tRNA formyltransferase
MNKKGFEVLSKLISYGKDISAVVSAQDKNLLNDYFKDIKQLCQTNDIAFYERRENYIDRIKADYIITLGWRWLIKGKLQNNLIVSHDSLLPKYRGFSPLVNMLIKGEDDIGVTFLFASKEYDSGEIIIQKKQRIEYPIKIINAIKIVSELFLEGVLEIYEKIERGEKLKSIPQEETKATYSVWRNEDDYLINFHESSENIKRFIDAVGYPYKGASSFIGKRKVRILDAEIYEEKCLESRDIGKVLFIKNKKPVVICKEGMIVFNEILDDITRETILPLPKFRIKFSDRE